MKKKYYNMNRGEKFFYGFGNLGYGAVSQTYNNFIMAFGTMTLGISGSLMGFAVAISVIWDAFTDPVVGYLSDRQNSRIFGRRHAFLLFGFLGMAIFNLFIWAVPSALPELPKFFWLLFAMLSLETFNTMFATPHTALGAELSDDYNEKTSIQQYKTIFYLISMIIPSALLFLFGETGVNGEITQTSYINISLITSMFCIVTGLACFFGTYPAVQRLRKEEKKQGIVFPKTQFKEIFTNFFKSFKNQNYRNLVLGYSISLISGAFLTSLGIHLFTYTFKISIAHISLLLGTFLFATLISQFFWTGYAKKHDKKPSVLLGIKISLIGIAGFFILFLLRGHVSYWGIYAISSLCLGVAGFGTGPLYSLPFSMFADIIAIQKSKETEERTATYSSFMMLSYKMTNAITLITIGVLLDIVRFDAKNVTNSVETALGFIAIIGIGLALVIGYSFYKKYNLTKEEVEKAIKNKKQG